MEHAIPNIIHFCYLGGKPFSIINYLSVKSAYEVNNPSYIFFYYSEEPEGYWWIKAKELLSPIPINPPKYINNNYLHLPHHQSDIVRLEKLLQYGGIYLDLDTICVRAFTDLLDYTFVMAKETYNKSTVGLCNAVILSKKDAFFCEKWLAGYKKETSLWEGFRSTGYDQYWNEMSVQYPYHLSKIYPDEITILDSDCFFYPSYSQAELDNFFLEDKILPSNAYCHHLWMSATEQSYLKNTTFESIKTGTSTFNKIAKRFI